ncbi:MAG TPA: SUMF1/EgtB/PvdO family nonheme iron enzyme [Polyangiaceae bacterium]
MKRPRWIVPAAAIALGALASVAGCAEETGGTTAATSPAVAPARFPVTTVAAGGTHFRGERKALGARSSWNGGAEGPRLLPLLPLGERGHSPMAPFENLLGEGDRPQEPNGLCPPEMASIDDRYCVDRYEASLVEVLSNGDERRWSAFTPVEGHSVRAVSEPGVVPQGYISEIQAQEACGRSGKRLCKPAEWRKACMGPEPTTYGYGRDNEPGRCNDSGRSPVVALYGSTSDLGDRGQWNYEHMNDPALNQLDGTLAATGSHEGCTNGYGVYDMVGNLHEWVADPNGTFQGGYYQDTHLNGDGCTYKTMAHAAWYHDYSTGFRCCADVAQ